VKSLIVAAIVSLVFAVFFTAFLIAPIIVIGLAYVVMTWQAKQRSKRARRRAAAATADEVPA
jgi:chromate transport protein ChrA